MVLNDTSTRLILGVTGKSETVVTQDIDTLRTHRQLTAAYCRCTVIRTSVVIQSRDSVNLVYRIHTRDTTAREIRKPIHIVF
jgi:hypothetical protein